MKSINNKIALIFFLVFFSSTLTQAQEVIKDSVVAPVKKVKSSQRSKN